MTAQIISTKDHLLCNLFTFIGDNMKHGGDYILHYNQKKYPLYNPELIRMNIGSSDFIVNYLDMLDESCIEMRHVHEDGYEIYYCLDGTQHLMLEDKCCTLNEGDFVILKPGTHHNTLYEPRTKKHYVVFVFSTADCSASSCRSKASKLESDFLSETLEYFKTNPFFYGHDVNGGKEIIKKLLDEISNKKAGSSFMISALYQQYLISILRCMYDNPYILNSDSNSKINLAVEITKYMHANYYKNISVQDIADEFYLSPRHVNRVFSDYFGQSFKRTLNIYRLNYAKNYLIDTNYSVEKIAELVGLSSPKMLYQLFQEVDDMTLADFRSRVKHPV